MQPDPPQDANKMAELERKKQKLAEMRALRNKAQHQQAQQVIAASTSQNGTARQTATADELRDILAGVGVDPEPRLGTPDRSNGVVGTPNVSPMASQVVSSGRSLTLELTSPQNVTIAQKEMAAYSKTTQTDDERISVGEFSLGSQEFDYDDDMMHMDGGFSRGRAHSHDLESPMTEDLASLLPGVRSLLQSEVTVTKGAESQSTAPEAPSRPRDLTDEEKTRIMASDEFQRVFARAAKIIENALAERDVGYDYCVTKGEVVSSNDLLTLSRTFSDKRVANRLVTDIAFSDQFPELILVGYDQDEHDPFKPTGVAIVWNTKMKRTTPEYVFNCQSRITSVAFASFHQHLLLAGCYSGQICMWDIRVEHKKSPISKSALSSAAHTHPVYSLDVMGTHNAHNLVSVSADGKMCSWNVDNLSAPVESKNLTQKGGVTQIPTLCVSFPVSDTNNFVLGSEGSLVYQMMRHAGATPAIVEQGSYVGHTGSVTAVNFHRAVGVVDFSHIFISASIDWSIRLWSTKDPQIRFTFESHMDFVYDVAWSPVHPAVFASLDSEGNLFLWNLNQDIEGPVSTYKLQDLNGGDGQKLKWSENGQQLVCGDSKGFIYIFDVHESLYVLRSEEWTQFARVLSDMKQQRLDELADEMSSTVDGPARLGAGVGGIAGVGGGGSGSLSSVAVLAGANVSPRAL